MKRRDTIALCLVFAAILTAEACLPFAAGCIGAALLLTGVLHGRTTTSDSD